MLRGVMAITIALAIAWPAVAAGQGPNASDRQAAAPARVLRSYAVSDLIDDRFESDADSLLNILRCLAAPDDWAPSGESKIALRGGGTLTVHAPQSTHVQLDGLLARLRNPPAAGDDDARSPELMARMNTVVDSVQFDGVKFSEALEWFSRRGLNITPDWRAMEQLGLTRDTDVNLRLRNVRLQTVLHELLRRVAGRSEVLDWSADGDGLCVSTLERLSAKMTVRLYNVKDLLNLQPWTRAENVDHLMSLIRSMVMPDCWAPTGDRYISEWHGYLVVNQSGVGHRLLAELLAMIRASLAGNATIVGDRSAGSGLEAAIPAIDFAQTPLKEALARLADASAANITVNWGAMAQLGISPGQEVTLKLPAGTLAVALDHLLIKVAGRAGVLGYAATDGVIRVSDREDLDYPRTIRIYNASDLIARTPGARSTLEDIDRFLNLVRTMVLPDSWAPTGDASVLHLADGRLLINQSLRGHRQLAEFLAQLRNAPPPGRTTVQSDKLARALASQMSEIRFAKIHLDNALNFLRDLNRVEIQVNWGALEQLGITRQTEVSLNIRDVLFETVLRELLARVAGREDVLDYQAVGDVIAISTLEDLSTIKDIRLYDVNDLIYPPAGRPGGTWVDNIFTHIRTFALPDSWAPTGDASILEHRGRLIIKQSADGHRRVAELLALIRAGRTIRAASIGPGDANPANARLAAQMQKNIPEIRFRGIQLENALSFLRDLNRVNIVANWGALEQLGITRPTEIRMELTDVPFEAALRQVLVKAAGREDVLDFILRDGVIKVSTREDLNTIKTLRLYDLADLVTPAGPGGITHRDMDPLLTVIRWSVLSDSWAPTGDCCLAHVEAGRLLVKQTDAGHRDLERLFALMRSTLTCGQRYVGRREIDALLGRRVQVAGFAPATLEKVLEDLSRQAKLPVSVNWGAIDSGIDRDELVVRALPGPGTLAETLDTLMARLPKGLAWSLRDDGILVSTRKDIDTIAFIRVYNVADVVTRMPQALIDKLAGEKEGGLVEGGLFGSGLFDDDRASRWPPDLLREMLRRLAGSPVSWAPTGNCFSLYHRGMLIVRQTWDGHRQVTATLDELADTFRFNDPARLRRLVNRLEDAE